MGITATQSDILRKTATGAFNTVLNRNAAAMNFARFMSATDTNAKSKDFGWWGAVPFPREWTGSRAHKGLKPYSDRITPKKWELTIDVEAETFEDDQTKMLSQLAGSMAARAQEFFAKRFTDVLEAGTGTTIDAAYDGVSFFNDAHAESGSNQDNNRGSTVTATASPTAAEVKTAVGDGIETFMAFTDDQGNPQDPSPNGIVCMIPPTHLEGFTEALSGTGALFPGNSQLAADTTSVSGVYRGMEVVVNPYLTNTDRFYFLRPSLAGGVGPMILVNRIPWRFDVFTPADSQQANENDVITFAARARFEVGYGDWRSAMVHVFST